MLLSSPNYTHLIKASPLFCKFEEVRVGVAFLSPSPQFCSLGSSVQATVIQYLPLNVTKKIVSS